MADGMPLSNKKCYIRKDHHNCCKKGSTTDEIDVKLQNFLVNSPDVGGNVNQTVVYKEFMEQIRSNRK